MMQNKTALNPLGIAMRLLVIPQDKLHVHFGTQNRGSFGYLYTRGSVDDFKRKAVVLAAANKMFSELKPLLLKTYKDLLLFQTGAIALPLTAQERNLVELINQMEA